MSTLARPSTPGRAAWTSSARARACAAGSPSSAPRSSPPSPTSIPGNFATNISGGAKYGFLLVWVILAANAMAMLVQYLSAKIGIATGRNLAELCREHFPTPVRWGLWVQAEIVAIATDLAEFVGAAIALHLLFGVPPLAAGLITAVVAFGILALQQRGYRHFELAIAALLGIILLGFLYDLTHVSVDGGALAGGLDPRLRGHGQRHARRRHHRRDRHAARRLPALGADAGPDPPAQHGGAAGAPARRPRRRGRRARHRRADQPLDARHRRLAVPRARARGGDDRGRPRRPRHPDRRRRRARVRGGAARLGPEQLLGRHLRRPGRDAGLHPPPHPAAAARGS